MRIKIGTPYYLLILPEVMEQVREIRKHILATTKSLGPEAAEAVETASAGTLTWGLPELVIFCPLFLITRLAPR